MNLMYLKNLRGDRDGGTAGLLSGPGRVNRSRGIDGGGGAMVAGGGGGGAMGPGSSRSWFTQSGSSYRVPPNLGVTSSTVGAPSTGAQQPGTDMHHLRTHLLMDLHSGKHVESMAGNEDRTGSASTAKWSSTTKSDPNYRCAKVRGDSSTESASLTGSRSVRSGLYDTEVCLSVTGLGNVRGTMTAARSGKQVSFGRRSPSVSDRERGTLDRPRDLETYSNKDKRPPRDRSVSSNKENDRVTLPRSAIVASRRSPDRDTRPRTRDEALGSRQRHPTADGAQSRNRREMQRTTSEISPLEYGDPEDLNLNNITRDCFIVPVHQVHRFLPEGISLPQRGRSEINVLEVEDPQFIVLLHFMTPFMSIQPIFESPLARPEALQRNVASQLLIDLLKERPGAHGMLLVSIEQDADYPFINYGIVNRQKTNYEEWQQTARLASLERFEPQTLRYFSDHLIDVYEEAATIARPPLQPSCRKPTSTTTGYIVCVYKVFDGDDGERFDRNWLYWTGARILYQCIPKNVNLKRITLHKSLSPGDKLYTLMCECSSFSDNLQDVAFIAPALRARLCGYCSLYRVAEIY